VTRKITDGVARIKLGLADQLSLGNLDAKRDWGYAKEYAYAMWLMLQQPEPDDFVIATGEMHTVRELCGTAFALAGLDWRDYVRVDPEYFRPTEVDELCGDASKAERVLGWRATTRFNDLVRMMLAHDLRTVGIEPAFAKQGEGGR
jgi:GDPmannose 4,6-dehydratase